jgi:hypothetical protein
MATDEELAARIRRLTDTLHRVGTDAERRARAAELLREAEELLSDGEPRLRWYELDERASGRGVRSRDLSPWSGAINGVAPPMRIQPGQREEQPCMVGRVRLSRLREGPAAGVHGGVIAGLFDEILAAGQRLAADRPGVTGRLVVRYRRITPIDTDLVFRSWVERDRGLRLDMRAECLIAATLDEPQPTRTADAEAFFVRQRS